MPRIYSQRMLNPYHGIVNVVEIEGADAVCRDGVNWMLYIQGGTELARSDEGVESQVPLPDIKFGTWSRMAGLKRAPVRYVTDYDQVDWLGSRLLEAVKSRSNGLPFPHGDKYELWLLDGASAQPLALLASVCDERDAGAVDPIAWNPGQAARESFRRTGKHTRSVDEATQLARLVRAAAGSAPAAQWFLREDRGGGGTGLSCSRDLPELRGRRLRRDAFPELLLRSDWSSQEDSALVSDFHAWQAPWLLALQTISRATRSWLERAARARALLTDQLYPNYPEIIDPGVIKAARVEAALRRASQGRPSEDPSRTSFFVTGN